MAASVHHGHLIAQRVFGGRGAGKSQAGLLFDGQRVHIGPHQHRRPGTIAQDAYHSAPAHGGGHLITCFAQFVGNARRGLFFLKGKLRMRVKIPVQIKQTSVLLLHMVAQQFAR